MVCLSYVLACTRNLGVRKILKGHGHYIVTHSLGDQGELVNFISTGLGSLDRHDGFKFFRPRIVIENENRELELKKIEKGEDDLSALKHFHYQYKGDENLLSKCYPSLQSFDKEQSLKILKVLMEIKQSVGCLIQQLEGAEVESMNSEDDSEKKDFPRFR